MENKHIFSFCLLECIAWCLLSLLYYLVSGFYFSVSGILFTTLFIPGQMFLFALVLLGLLMLSRLIGKKTALVAALVLGFLFNVFFILDIFVYSQYRFHVSLAMLQLFFGPAGGEIFVFPPAAYLIAGLVVVCTTAGTWGLIHLARKINLSIKKIIVCSLLFLFCFVGYNGMYAWGKFMLVPSVLTQITYLPMVHPLSMNRRLRKMGFKPRTQAYEMPRAGQLNYPLAPLACAATQTPNILVILIDAWRADTFSPEVTPTIYKQYQNAPDAFYFSNHISGGNATAAGVFSLFYSMPYAYWDNVSGARVRPVLMDELVKRGYQFGIYASGRLDSPEFNKNVFSHIDGLRSFTEGDSKWQRDEKAQQEFLHFLNTREPNKPFFGFLFYDAAHGYDFPADAPTPFTPYSSEMNYLLLTKNTDSVPYLNRFKNSVHYIDSLLARVFAKLKEKGLDKNTVVILTGDHGQELNDCKQNFWGHNSNFAKYQTQVPLLVWWPGKKGGNISYRTSHYDLVPTLLTHLFNCTNPVADYAIGQDLFDASPRPWTILSNYTEKAIREEDKISVLNDYGGMVTYDENCQRQNTPVSAKALSDSLKEFSHFYK